MVLERPPQKPSRPAEPPIETESGASFKRFVRVSASTIGASC
jgi:hypothetical protein